MEEKWSQEMIEEFEKCKNDILYFAENYFYINCIDEGNTKLKLHPYQKNILEMYKDNRFSLLMSSRQASKTIMSSIFVLWTAIFKEDQRIFLATHSEKSAKFILNIIKSAYEKIPDWIRPSFEYDSDSLKLENGSFIEVKSLTKNDIRGYNANLLVMDELAFFPEEITSEFWAYAYPIIKSSNISKIIIASTPKQKSGLFYELYDGSVKGENNLANMKVLWNDVPGRDEQWKKFMIESLGDISIFEKEFNCEF